MITDEEFEAATRRGEEERGRVPAITGVSYRRRQRELVIHFAVGMKLTVPVAIVQELHDAPPAALREVKIEGAGTVLYWPRLDVSLWMPDLLAGDHRHARLDGGAGADGAAARAGLLNPSSPT